jgi:nicotinamidase-related amidase
MEHPALLIIDMVKDNFVEARNLPITPLARKIIEPVNRLADFFRRHDWPVIFSTDAFQAQDFIFSGRMPPHSLAGTEGAEVIDDLVRSQADYWLPKPRFSAFFRTGLENWLNERGVTLCAVTGIATHFCVLTTAMDALCHDFKAVVVEDCSTAPTDEIHRQVIDTYRRNPLYPLFQVMAAAELMQRLSE